MLKNFVQWSHKIEEFEGLIHFTPNTPIPIAKELLFQCLKYLGQIEDSAAQQAQAAPLPKVESEAITENQPET